MDNLSGLLKIKYFVHIDDRTDNRFSCRMFNTFTNPKISDFDFSFGINKYILRFDISVDGMPHTMNIIQS